MVRSPKAKIKILQSIVPDFLKMKTDDEGSKEKVILSIADLHCASCVARVEGALGALKGVRSASVNLASKTAAVEFDPKALKPQDIRRTVEAEGYKVLGMGKSYREAESLSNAAQEAESQTLWLRLCVGAVLWGVVMFEHPLEISVYTTWVAATVVLLWCGWHFHRGLWESLSARRADMNTLVSLSTWASFLFSMWVIFLPAQIPEASRSHQLDAVCGLVVMITLGRWLEVRLRRRTNEAVRKMLLRTPKTVRVMRDGKEVVLPISDVRIGERIMIRPGELVGLDAVVEDGSSTVDEALLTGESLPIEKAPGARVFAGTMNKTGALVATVDRIGSDTFLSKIIESVRASAASKAPVQRVVDRVAAYFVPGVIVIAVAASGLWFWLGPEPRLLLSITVLVSVLSVACPCALGLATPMAIIMGMGRAAEMGIFLRDAEVLEKAGKLDAVLFDKTGTLTEGVPSVVEMIPDAQVPVDELLRYAVTAENRSEHPYAAAVRTHAAARNISAGSVESFEVIPGRGVRAASEGKKILVGSLVWLSSEGVAVSEAVQGRLRTVSGPVLAVAVDGHCLGALVLADRLRSTAREAVARLEAMGLDMILVSGDRRQSVLPIAVDLGIVNVYSALLPDEKSRIIQDLQSQGKRVAMVGEGFNDAPALSRADVGIALATGTDVAVESADITLMRPDLKNVAVAIGISRRIRRVIRENLVWAFLYNAILLPVAAGALYPWLGNVMAPQYAGAAMALSSISVILNSMKLRRFKA